jgi:hypothetical protein
MLPSVQEMEAYIRQVAAANGVDPDTAVRVARSEGLAPGVWQANGNLSYGRERSYGPFQLHVAPAGHRGGMGNDMLAQTGVDPSNPANWRQGVDFAIKRAAKGGWSPWYGAKKIGVTGMMGINGRPTGGAAPAPVAVRDDRGAPFNNGLGTAAPTPAAASGAPPQPSMWEVFDPAMSSGSSIGSALAGLAQPQQVQAGGGMTNYTPPPVDYASMMEQMSQPGMQKAAQAKEQMKAPEVGSLAEILGDLVNPKTGSAFTL